MILRTKTKCILVLTMMVFSSLGLCGFRTDDIHEQAPIQANIVTQDLKHVYYIISKIKMYYFTNSFV